MADTCWTRTGHGQDGSAAPAAHTVRVLSLRQCPRVTVVALHGDIDLLHLPALDAGLDAALHRRTHLLIDLSDVHLIDCACLNVLVRASRTARQNNTGLALIAPPTLVRLSLHATRLAAAFPTFTDVRHALGTLAAGPADAPAGSRGNTRRHRRNARHNRLSPNGTRP